MTIEVLDSATGNTRDSVLEQGSLLSKRFNTELSMALRKTLVPQTLMLGLSKLWPCRGVHCNAAPNLGVRKRSLKKTIPLTIPLM